MAGLDSVTGCSSPPPLPPPASSCIRTFTATGVSFQEAR